MRARLHTSAAAETHSNSSQTTADGHGFSMCQHQRGLQANFQRECWLTTSAIRKGEKRLLKNEGLGSTVRLYRGESTNEQAPRPMHAQWCIAGLMCPRLVFTATSSTRCETLSVWPQMAPPGTYRCASVPWCAGRPKPIPLRTTTRHRGVFVRAHLPLQPDDE